MKIVLNKCEYMEDWYTIVRAEHNGREWFEKTSPNCARLMMSERLSPEACIEGTACEMIALAKSIQKREGIWFRRCAVHFEKDGVHFSSPKNSEHDGIVSIEDADDFAAQVLLELN